MNLNLLNTINSKKKGVTLVEILVYLGVFGVVFMSIISFSIRINDLHNIANQRKVLEKDLVIINAHLKDSLSKATSINTANSIFNNNSGVLELSNSAEILKYSIISNNLSFQKASESFQLNNPNVGISKLYLQEVKDGADTTIAVKTNLSIYLKTNTKINSDTEALFTLK